MMVEMNNGSSEKPGGFLDRLIVEVSDKCSSRCTTCRIWTIRNPATLSLDILDRQVARTGAVSILKRLNISGGEPFERTDLAAVHDLFRRYAGGAFLVSCITNGQWPDRVRELVTHFAPAGPVQLFVSLDGPTSEVNDPLRGSKGAFENSLETIRTLVRIREKYRNVRVGVSFTASRRNFDTVYATHRLAVDLGVDFIARPALKNGTFYLNGPTSQTWELSCEQLAIVHSQLQAVAAERSNLIDAQRFFFQNTLPGAVSWRDYDCWAGVRSACIRPNGDVVACLFSPWTMGNVHASTLDEILASADASRARQRIAARECTCWNDSETLSTWEYNRGAKSVRAGW